MHDAGGMDVVETNKQMGKEDRDDSRANIPNVCGYNRVIFERIAVLQQNCLSIYN